MAELQWLPRGRRGSRQSTSGRDETRRHRSHHGPVHHIHKWLSDVLMSSQVLQATQHMLLSLYPVYRDTNSKVGNSANSCTFNLLEKFWAFADFSATPPALFEMGPKDRSPGHCARRVHCSKYHTVPVAADCFWVSAISRTRMYELEVQHFSTKPTRRPDQRPSKFSKAQPTDSRDCRTKMVLIVQQCASLWMQRLKHNLAGDWTEAATAVAAASVAGAVVVLE